MSLIAPHSQEHQKIKDLEKGIYQSYKFSTCQVHFLPKELVCIDPKCPFEYSPICSECHKRSHPLLSIRKLVTKLTIWAQSEWSRIQQEQREVDSQWKVCLVNINYCLDILKELKKQVEERGQKKELVIFRTLLAQIHGMYKKDSSNVSPEMLLRNFKRLNQQYQLIVTDEQPAHCQQAEEERSHRLKQVKQASVQTKAFSERALAFSEDLARLIEERFRCEKRIKKLKDLTANRVFCLRDLIAQKDEQKLEEVGDLLIEMPKQGNTEIGLLLDKCKNLKSLHINNRNGAILRQTWNKIAGGMEQLKFLKELILSLRAKDLPLLTELFRQRSKAVRQVQRLSLQITDQKQLNVTHVSAFCNTLQLRGLNLTLTRDNLTKNQVSELVKGLRVHTSLSQLPMVELNVNVSKNKVRQDEESSLQGLFEERCRDIKQKCLKI